MTPCQFSPMVGPSTSSLHRRGKDRGAEDRGRSHQHKVTGKRGTKVATPKNYSVMKAFALLKAFRDGEEWVSSSELSRRANLPEASGYRLIQTLEDVGAVVRAPPGRYGTGPS